jgi:hypothetical protein
MILYKIEIVMNDEVDRSCSMQVSRRMSIRLWEIGKKETNGET